MIQPTDHFDKNQHWLIVAFAPGAYGHKLGQWLLNNQLVNVVRGGNRTTYATSSAETNHHYHAFFTDVLLTDGTSEDYVKKEFAGHFPNSELVQTLLEQSNYASSATQNKYNLILTHYSQYRVLYELSLLLPNSKVVRIVFDSEDQAVDTIKRKRSLGTEQFDINNDCGDLCDNYFPFLHKFNFSIDVPMANVNNLELDFLKDLL